MYRYIIFKFLNIRIQKFTGDLFLFQAKTTLGFRSKSLRIDERKNSRWPEKIRMNALAAFMLIPINSDPIVAVIIEATTADRKSLARRLDVLKMAPSEIRAHSDSRWDVCMLMHTHRHTRTHTPLVYTIVGALEESRLAICGKAARPCGTGPHNGLCIFSRRYRRKKSGKYDRFSHYSLRSLRKYLKVLFYNVSLCINYFSIK